MTNWESETGKYLPRLDEIYKIIVDKPALPRHMPSPAFVLCAHYSSGLNI